MGVVVSRIIGRHEPDARAELYTLSGLSLLNVTPVYFTRQQEYVKRMFDIVSSCIILILVAPVLILCALGVKLTSKGPILYRSLRVGLDGRHFQFVKFRSMFADAAEREAALAALNEKRGHIFKIRNDPRVTPVGRFLRHYSLDELPQLFNVLRGDMSLVGPRPLPANDLDPDGQSDEFAIRVEQRSRVLPGITGLWQVEGRSSLSFEQMVVLDLEYIPSWSLLLDLKLLARTPKVVVTGKGAF
jgi:lipopolysaccharide/colanic/teichoic acid biosynthesis glycosyltransferase